MPRVKNKPHLQAEPLVLQDEVTHIITKLEELKPSKTSLQQEIMTKWLTQLYKINTEMQQMEKLEKFSNRVKNS